jgi:hypothetical protein
MQLHSSHDENLDPRRTPRGIRRRDWASMSRTVSLARVHELLATALVRLGLAR